MKISKKMIIGFLALLMSAPHLLLADAGEGALFGGLTGATIGGLAGGGRGAGIGALVGLGAGAAIGAASDRNRNRYYDDGYDYETVYSTDNSAQIAQLKETQRTLRNRLRAAKNRRAQNKLKNNIKKIDNQINTLQ